MTINEIINAVKKSLKILDIPTLLQIIYTENILPILIE